MMSRQPDRLEGAMQLSRRVLLGTAAAAALPVARVRAQLPTIRIGVLNDQSGIGRDATGLTAVACVRRAVEEFGPSDRGFNAEIISADHQQKADIALSIARQWFDQEGVDFIIGVPNSAIALAIQALVKARNKVFISTDSGSSRLTGDQCSPNMLHWAYDTYMLAHSTGGALVHDGWDSWYFITADFAAGHQLQKDTSTFIERAGGKVLGASLHPFAERSDFASLLLKAQDSGAKVLGLATFVEDAQNCIKQAAEFGITRNMKIAALLMSITDVHAMGLRLAQSLLLTESFYWDLNDRTRAFTKRVLPKTPNNYPNMQHAGCYAGTLHYLKTVADMGAAEAKMDGVATVNRMKAVSFDDDCFGTGKIREDGRVLVNAYLFEVKKPGESRTEWDLYKLIATTPGEQAFRPLEEGGCYFVKAKA
jgi:branched-chain amino acid transport system substrate-binding protein